MAQTRRLSLFIARVAKPQVTFDNAGIADEVAGPAFEHDFAGFQDIAVIGHLKRRARVLLDQQNRHACKAQPRNNVEDLAHDLRRQPPAGFVENQPARRTEARRVGQEWVSTYTYRWPPA